MDMMKALLSKERQDIIQELQMAKLMCELIQERAECEMSEPKLDPIERELIQLAGNLKKKDVIDRALQIYEDKMRHDDEK